MESLVSTKVQSWLSWFLKGILVLGFLFLTGRLIELQIIKGNYFRSLSDENRIKRVILPAPRGKILARGGEVLAGADFAHITGYVSEANADEVGKVDPDCPDKGPRKVGAQLGRDGLEKYYDCRLRGFDGERLVEVDTAGKEIRTIGIRNPVVGEDLTTNIDFKLQKKIADIVKADKDVPVNPKGAVVVTDARGEILVLYSFPSYDPDNLTSSLTNPNLPLFNRATSGAYHPGSTFKIITSTAALEDHKINDSYTYEDPGVIKIKDFSYSNWYFSQYGKTEGVIDLRRAIARSTDTFFYKLGEIVGVDSLAKWAGVYGLGKLTGVDLPGEATGLVPTPEWKEQVKGEAWFLGNTYHMAIGQGDLLATPLQVNLVTSVVGNGGKLCSPRLVGRSDCKSLNVGRKTLAEIKDGMIGACSTGGTAYPFFDFTPQVACKTGTAETEEKDKTHAWFTAFMPADDPQLTVTVIVEKAGEGSVVAAPIAKEVFKYWQLITNP